MGSTTAEPEYYNTQGSTTVDGIRSEEPSFSGSFSDNKHYMIPKVKDRAAMTQRLQSRRDERIPEHWETLLQLKNKNIGLNCAIYSKSPYRIMEIVSPNTPFGNLKDYVLDGCCHSYVMIKILSQLASAQTYLHENHIVHGDFRSEHVNVLGPCQVQVVCLGHSKYLKAGEVNSRSGKVQDTMPADAIRWSAFEVITEGIYSHASDVWAFGVVLWELYAALAFRRKRSTLARPYYELADDQILGHIQKGRRLYQPPGCPDWMYNIMELCWSKQRQNRPPSEVLRNCFVSRNPMQSWNLWLDQHDKRVIVVLQI